MCDSREGATDKGDQEATHAAISEYVESVTPNWEDEPPEVQDQYREAARKLLGLDQHDK